jgi:hypothetical protein
VVHPDDVESYVARFDPLCLRNSVGTMKDLDLPFLNFGGVKGRTVDRVLIAPTKPIVAFLAKGTPLADKSACGLYVGITRAKFSVAFIATPEDLPALTQWVPPTSA